MRSLGTVLAALLLAACGSQDQDKLPDDLTSAEGTPRADPAFEKEPEPEPAPANDSASNFSGNAIIVGDDLAPKREATANPSFDCSGTLSRIEAQICRDPEVAALDRKLAADYARAMEAASPEERERLTNLGRQYLGDRDRCTSRTCVIQAYRWYRKDIATLMNWPTP